MHDIKRRKLIAKAFHHFAAGLQALAAAIDTQEHEEVRRRLPPDDSN